MKTRQIKHLLINFDDYSVSSYGVDIKMDHMALDVLKLLLENTGETVQNNHLMDEVWKDKPSSPEVIPAAISRLRKMFKQTGVGEDLITTVHKIGYKLELPKDDVVSDTVKEVVVKRQNNYLLWALWFIGGLLAAYFYLSFPATKEVTKPVERLIRSTSQDSASSLETDEVQLFILRHTEKQEPDAEDPQLSEQGIKRAQYWARVLQDVQFDAVYTTNFKRNIQTAELVTEGRDVELKIYYPMSFDVKQFLQQEQGKRILIIGHSNTIPDMVNRLLGSNEEPPMSHENYNLLYIVNIDQNSRYSTLLHIENP